MNKLLMNRLAFAVVFFGFFSNSSLALSSTQHLIISTTVSHSFGLKQKTNLLQTSQFDTDSINLASQQDSLNGFGLTIGYQEPMNTLGINRLTFSLGCHFYNARMFGNRYVATVDKDFNSDVDLKSFQLLLSTKANFQGFEHISPFLGLGVGIESASAKYNDIAIPGQGNPADNLSLGESNSNKFIYQLSFGADYAVSKQVSLNTGYRFTDAGNVETKSKLGLDQVTVGPVEVQLPKNQIFFGASYKF